MAARPRGLALAREKGWLLAWDENNSLCLFNRQGARQAQICVPGELTAACCADDGSAYAAAGNKGKIWWLAPDLSTRWERSVSNSILTVATDPFGQYLAAADTAGNLHLWDRTGRLLHHVQSPKPLHHLAFVPGAPFLVGCGDYGLIASFDPAGRCVWRQGVVAHIGSLAVSGTGEHIILACFTQGLQRYTLQGKNAGRVSLAEPCRLAAVSFDGKRVLIAGLSHRLLLCNYEGRTRCEYQAEKSPLALAFGALGDTAFLALGDGRVVALELREAARP